MLAGIIDNAIGFAMCVGRIEVGVWADSGNAVLRVHGAGQGLPLVTAVARRRGARIALDDAHPGLAITVRFEAFRVGGDRS